MTEAQYQEFRPTRAVNGDQFIRGPIDTPINIGRPSAWVPSKSYFRIEMELLGYGTPATAVQPKVYEQTAFADDACSQLFKNAYFNGNNQSMSSITNGLGQAGALKKRISRSNSWLKSFGKDAYMSEADFGKRVLAVSDGTGNDTTMAGSRAMEMHRGTVPNATYRSAVVALTATSAVCTASESVFVEADEGSIIVVKGVEYRIKSYTTPTAVVLSHKPTVDVVGTKQWYMIRKNVTRSVNSRNKVYAIWQPPLGIFDYDEPMGSGSYNFRLSPDSNYKFAAVESKNPLFTGTGTATTYTLNILDISFFAYTLKVDIPDQVSTLHLPEMNVQSKPYATSLQYTVPSSTKALTFFIQSNASGSDPRIPSSMFKGNSDSDLNLHTIQCNYGGVIKTATPWQSEFSGNTNMLLQRYHDSIREAGSDVDILGSESFDDWLKRGVFVHFDFSLDIDNRATEVQLNTDYAAPKPTTADLMYCVSWYTNTVEYTTSNGMIVDVKSLQV